MTKNYDTLVLEVYPVSTLSLDQLQRLCDATFSDRSAFLSLLDFVQRSGVDPVQGDEASRVDDEGGARDRTLRSGGPRRFKRQPHLSGLFLHSLRHQRRGIAGSPIYLGLMLSWFKRKRRRKRPKRKRRLFRDIYLLWSPRYGHKIGISDEARRRRAWIKEDGLPGVLILVGWFSVVDAPGIEEDLHRRFDRFRYTIRPQVSGRTEFFRLGGIRSRLPVLSWLLGFLRACWVWWLMFEVWIAQRLFVVLVISAISYLAVKVIC